MVEESQSDSSVLSNLDFIFLHPQIIFFSFLIVFNMIQAYAGTIPPLYRARAILLFEGATADSARNAINKKKEAAEKILTGANVEPILREAMKNKSPAERKAAEPNLRAKLMNEKTGLLFTWVAKGGAYLLGINFSYTDPVDCYETVKATMNRIKDESEKSFTSEMEANLLFLTKQMNFYKDKVDGIDRELESMGPDQAIPEKNAYQDPSVKTYGASALPATPDLKASLAELQEKRRKLQASLEDGTFVSQRILEDIKAEDLFLNEYKQTIAAKEMEIDSLLSRGYKEEHPNVKALHQEINRAKEMRQKRMDRLKLSGPGSPEYEEKKKEVEFEIRELDLKIALITDNMRGINFAEKTIMETSLKDNMEKPENTVQNNSTNQEMAARRKFLQGERTINETYFFDMRKNLANAELKYRTENESVGFKISIVQMPEVPKKKDLSKSRDMIMKGFIVSILVGLGVGYVVFAFNGSIHSDHELYSLLEIPVIGTISSIMIERDVRLKKKRLKYAIILTVAIMVATRAVVNMLF